MRVTCTHQGETRTGLNAVSTRENLLDLTDSLEGAAIDKYSYTRDLYMRVRSQQTGAKLPENPEDNIDIDDLVDSDTAADTPMPEAEPAAPVETQPAQEWDSLQAPDNGMIRLH